MGLSHGGLRQKMFNVYEETINVPLVVSNPILFGRPARSEALVSLVDVLPTLLACSGREVPPELRGQDLTPILASVAEWQAELAGEADVDFTGLRDHPRPAQAVQDAIHFTYDDHQGGTAMQEAPGQPNRIRAIRTASGKYGFYFDPNGRAATEYELYDLERDPLETHNLLELRSAAPRSASARRLHQELAERLDVAMSECATGPG
jgi:arylsulfatase A-like enzyme